MVKKIEKELKSRFGNSLVLVTEDGFWKHYDAEYKGTAVTVLVVDSGSHNNGNWSFNAAVSAAALWKKIRHSGHMPYLDHYIDESSSSVMVIFEQLIPLASIFRSYCSTELLSVIYGIANAALHLHEKHELSHNCITLKSVYVVPSQRRRCVLGELQYCTPMTDAVGGMLARTKHLRPVLGIPEDDQRAEVAYAGASIWCRDSYGIARIAKSLLVVDSEHTSQIANWCSESLNDSMQPHSRQSADCLAAGFITEHAKISPPIRPSVAALTTLRVFNSCAMVAIQQGLDLLTISGVPPIGYYASLYSLLKSVPYYIIEESVLPAFLTRSFWIPSNSIVFTPRILRTDLGGCLIARDRQKVVNFLITSLESDPQMKTPVLRILDILLQSLTADVVTRVVLPALLETLRVIKDYESVFWCIHGLITSLKWLLHEAGSHQDIAIDILNNKILPLMVQTSLSTELSIRIRSASLLGMVQLISQDCRLNFDGLLSALTGCLLSGNDSLRHHSLNAVIMVEGALPLSTLCLNILPALAVVMLSSNVKLREKCNKVTELILQSLEGAGEEDDLEDHNSPPLLRGSPLVVSCLKKESKRPQVAPREDGSSVVATTTSEKECELDMLDKQLNQEGVLAVAGNVERDLRTLTEVIKSGGTVIPPGARQYPPNGGTKDKITSRKKKGTRKAKHSLQPSPKHCPEENALAMWEKKTYDDEGEPYSTSLASTLRVNDQNGSVSPSGGESDSLFAGTTLHNGNLATSLSAVNNGKSTPDPTLNIIHTSDPKPERRKKKRVMTKKKAGNAKHSTSATTNTSKPNTPLENVCKESAFSGLLLTEGVNVGSPTTNNDSFVGLQSPIEFASSKSGEFPKSVSLPQSVAAPIQPSSESIDDLLDMYGGDEIISDVPIEEIKTKSPDQPPALSKPNGTLVGAVAEQQHITVSDPPVKKAAKMKAKKKKPRTTKPVESVIPINDADL